MPATRSSLHVSTVRGALGALSLSLLATHASALTLQGEAAEDLTATVFASSLGNPVDAVELPDGRVVVIEKLGAVKTFTPGVEDPAVDNIAVVRKSEGEPQDQNEQGLLGIAADPDFAKNNYIYIYASVVSDPSRRHQVRRYTLGADGKLGAMKPVIDMGLMGPANHNGGGLSIHGGHLYVGVGDTGKNNAVPHNHIGSCLNLANGKVLRVKLSDDTSLGQPADDNPLVSAGMVSGCDTSSDDDEEPLVMRPPEKRIFAWGFRNPFRLWTDPVTGKVWVGDVGEASFEEVSLVEKGKHYGYPFEEGTKKYSKASQAFQPDGTCMGMTPPTACVPPIIDYPTKSGSAGGSVIGGRILDGCGWPEKWRSRYLFGDHEQGRVWSIDVNAARDGMVADSKKDFANTNGVVAIHMGTDNALYVVERGAGTVTRIVAKAAPPAEPGSCLTVNDPDAGGSGGAGGSSTGGSSTGGSSMGGSNAAGSSAAGSPGGGSGNPGGGSSSAGSANAGTGGSPDGASGAPVGAGASASQPGSSSDGCGCRVVKSDRGSAVWGLAAFVAALGMVLGRRARRS